MLLDILNKMLDDKEAMQHPVAYATVMALKQYVEQGGKLSNLPWFKGLNLELLEEQIIEKAS